MLRQRNGPNCRALSEAEMKVNPELARLGSDLRLLVYWLLVSPSQNDQPATK